MDTSNNHQKKIIVTGAAGFIGSCMVELLNQKGYDNLILVDDFGVEEKRRNWESKRFETIVERYNFFDWLDANEPNISCIIHLGARTDTTEFDYAIHQELNVEYSQSVWNYCTEHGTPLIYASSAATYGDGSLGYDDSHELVEKLQPLNPYGVSKNEFDKWAIAQHHAPPFWAGLKFFNVYGPNEAHKKRMASVIYHSFNQIKTNGFVKLFKSHKAGYADGQQLRDFVYVKDVVEVVYWMMEESLKFKTQNAIEELGDLEEESLKDKIQNSKFKTQNSELTTSELTKLSNSNQQLQPGLYNLGTGQARSFQDLVKATFAGLDKEARIEFIDMPEDIRDKYQYFTEANMQKLRNAGYTASFYSLEEGVNDYVRNYLAAGKTF